MLFLNILKDTRNAWRCHSCANFLSNFHICYADWNYFVSIWECKCSTLDTLNRCPYLMNQTATYKIKSSSITPFSGYLRFFIQFGGWFHRVGFSISRKLYFVLLSDHIDNKCNAYWWFNLWYILVSATTRWTIRRAIDHSTLTKAVRIERIGCNCLFFGNVFEGNISSRSIDFINIQYLHFKNNIFQMIKSAVSYYMVFRKLQGAT